jgi:hypothetical protein
VLGGNAVRDLREGLTAVTLLVLALALLVIAAKAL